MNFVLYFGSNFFFKFYKYLIEHYYCFVEAKQSIVKVTTQ